MDSTKESPKVRVIARIGGFLVDKDVPAFSEAETVRISVRRPEEVLGGKVSLSLVGEQKNSKQCNYQVDDYYERCAGNSEIFDSEVKPLISQVFQGRCATVFAYGARGSGKTYTIQGSDEDPGIAVLSMSRILSRAEENGNLVSISLYEVYQDHVFDLLDSGRAEVSVLEGANGKITLKGLSKIPVKSMSEFQKIYSSGTTVRKPLQKMVNQMPRRSHRGLIFYVLASSNENSDARLIGKMNVVDLAGYEDSKRLSNDGANFIDITRINKSLYAVHKVLHALNENETRVPYRESKLTRMLQESLQGTNKILMVTCMNSSLCDDTMKTLSLASQTCQAANEGTVHPTAKAKSATKVVLPSPKPMKPTSLSAFRRKGVGSLYTSVDRKPQAVEGKARRIFDEDKALRTFKQENISVIPTEVISTGITVEPPTEMQDNSTFNITNETDLSLSMPNEEVDRSMNFQEENNIGITPISHPRVTFLQEEKENSSLPTNNEAASPPLSARLQELSKNLKSLYNSTHSKIQMTQEIDSSTEVNELCKESVEPKTPFTQPSLSSTDRYQLNNMASPWERFNMCGSGMKDSLVQEYLKFLNSASKEELKGLKGIGEKRASYILDMRGASPEPFKSLDDLKEIGLSAKQIKGMMRNVAGDIFS